MKKYIVNILLLFFDIVFIMSLFLFIGIFTDYSSLLNPSMYKHLLLYLVVILLTLNYESIYTQRYDFWEETRKIIKALMLAFIIIVSIFLLDDLDESKQFLIYYFIIIIPLLPIYKRLVKKLLFKYDAFKKSVKIIGNKEQTQMLENEFIHNWYLGLKPTKRKPDIIYIASKNIEKEKIEKYIRKYSTKIKDIYLVPFLDEINFSNSQILELFNVRTSLIKMENNLLKIENILLKEFFEKILAILASFPFFLVIHPVLYFLIQRDSKGSVLFTQERLGKDGKIFKCYKYRSMYENGDEILKSYLEKHPDEIEYYKIYHKYKNDPRITKIGKILRKTSLDELPQLINVLKGEMNLIGPRPYMVEEFEKLGEDSSIILRVKPGISGLWQVSGRSNISFNDRKKLDIWYIQNWSLWMDVIILFKTLKVVLNKKGAK